MKCTKKKEKYYQYNEPQNLQNIQEKYKETVQIIFLEKEELQRMFIVITDKIRSLNAQNNALTREEKTLKRENDEFEYFIREKRQILKDLNDFLSVLSSQNSGCCQNKFYQNNLNQIIQTYPPNKQKLGEELLQDIQTEQSQIQQLKQFQNYIENKITNIQDQQQFWKCIRCSKKLKEGSNENDCIYHSGKLKYFSCRSCGADEYFTCCKQCRDCNKGCTIGLHKP